MALNNLSVRQSETGDRDGALASSTEAVQHYRALAEASPAAYLPDLATSLNNLSHLLEHSATGGGDPWGEAIAGFDDPLPQAELCAHYARALAADNKLDAAIEQLASAAAGADSGDPVPLGRARRAIRDVATALGASLGYSRRPKHIDLLVANESEKCLLSAIMRLSRFTVPRMERHLSRGFYGVVEGSGR